jgi:hypothetical protein
MLPFGGGLKTESSWTKYAMVSVLPRRQKLAVNRNGNRGDLSWGRLEEELKS